MAQYVLYSTIILVYFKLKSYVVKSQVILINYKTTKSRMESQIKRVVGDSSLRLCCGLIGTDRCMCRVERRGKERSPILAREGWSQQCLLQLLSLLRCLEKVLGIYCSSIESTTEHVYHGTRYSFNWKDCVFFPPVYTINLG